MNVLISDRVKQKLREEALRSSAARGSSSSNLTDERKAELQAERLEAEAQRRADNIEGKNPGHYNADGTLSENRRESGYYHLSAEAREALDNDPDYQASKEQQKKINDSINARTQEILKERELERDLTDKGVPESEWNKYKNPPSNEESDENNFSWLWLLGGGILAGLLFFGGSKGKKGKNKRKKR